jgi:hypothetical protein
MTFFNAPSPPTRPASQPGSAPPPLTASTPYTRRPPETPSVAPQPRHHSRRTPHPPQPRTRKAPATGALAPAWGWKIPDGGRAVNITAGPEYQATTTQLCGLYPFVAGSGTPVAGTPVGRHQLWGEVVCLDPLAWLRAGLVTNPGVFVLGQPGTGKSALVKRLVTGAVASGTKALILGDTKPDYTLLASHLGGQVIRIGRGLDKINPLDTGPLGTALRQMTGPQAAQLRWEVRSRRLSLLMALATLIREARLSNAEEVVLGRAVDLLDERGGSHSQPTVTDVLSVIETGPDTLRQAARADDPRRYASQVQDLVFTLDLQRPACPRRLRRASRRSRAEGAGLSYPSPRTRRWSRWVR